MIPFVTEELFTQLREKVPPATSDDPYLKEALEALSAPACIVAPYPTVIAKEDIDTEAEETFAFMDQVLHAVRNIRAEMGTAPNVATDLIIQASPDDSGLALVKENESMLSALIRLGTIAYNAPPPEGFTATNLVGNLSLIIPLPEEMREKELIRLKKQQDKLIQQEQQSRGKLGNENFVQKAPKEVVDKLRTQVRDIEAQLAEIAKKLTLFQK
jgi:valyl-tRNA synthetase